MKKIPNVFKPVIEKVINNNEKAFYSYKGDSSNISNINSESPIDTINRLMSSGGYIFNKKLIIYTKDKVYHTKIAGKVGKNVITLDGDSLSLDDISKIEQE